MSVEKAHAIATLTAGILAGHPNATTTTAAAWAEAEAIVEQFLEREREKITAIVTPKVEMTRHEQEVARSIATLLELESGELKGSAP